MKLNTRWQTRSALFGLSRVRKRINEPHKILRRSPGSDKTRYKNMLKTIYKCEECKGENIVMRGWFNPNTDQITDIDNADRNDFWCNDCEAHNGFEVVQFEAPEGWRDFEFAEIITRRVRIPASMPDVLEYVNCLTQDIIDDMEIVDRKLQGNHLSRVAK